MSKTGSRPRKTARKSPARRASRAPARGDGLLRRAWRWGLRGLAGVLVLLAAALVAFRFVAPPQGIYMRMEAARLDGIDRQWVAMPAISPHLARAVVAAEDANFCRHWGFDMGAIRAAIEDGASRGASTISQQTVKNVFLWQGRSWPRKALEAAITPLAEAAWPKRRMLEIYLNVAEFDTGVFGAEAAAQHHFGVPAAKLTPAQSALLAAALPAPQKRSVVRPSAWMQRRAAAIRAGAATIAADGRDACFRS